MCVRRLSKPEIPTKFGPGIARRHCSNLGSISNGESGETHDFLLGKLLIPNIDVNTSLLDGQAHKLRIVAVFAILCLDFVGRLMRLFMECSSRYQLQCLSFVAQNTDSAAAATTILGLNAFYRYGHSVQFPYVAAAPTPIMVFPCRW